MSKTVSETGLEIWAAIHKATETLDDEKARRMRRDGGNQRTDAIMNASATLKDHQHEMSAAPRMLALLEKWADIVQGGDNIAKLEPWAHDMVTEFRAAIRAARGEG